MEPLVATSFDRYARYSYVHRLRSESLAPAPIHILDVGDPYGTLATLFPDDDTVSIDLFGESPASGPRHQHLLGSGFQLPFRDGAFDLVTCHDVLEHLDDGGRPAFIDELLRVAGGPVVLVAPFGDPRAKRCEDLVNSYYVAHVGESLQPLNEHAEAGLPELDAVLAHLARRDVESVVYRDGWLFHWLGFMLLKAHYVSLGAAALDRATDAAFNRLLRARDERPPHYRRAIVLRPPSGVADPTPVPEAGDVEADIDELSRLAAEIELALPRGADPSLPGSELRDWVARTRASGAPASAFLAESVEIALDAARASLDVPLALASDANDARVRAAASAPTATAVVLAGAPDRVDATVAALQAQGLQDIAVCTLDGGHVPSAATHTVPVPSDDLALQVAHAAEVGDGDALLVVDPEVDVPSGAVARLLAGFDRASQAVCVGFHLSPDDAPAPARGIRPDGSDALYVDAGLMLVDRFAYRSLGGFDGWLGNTLGPVDFGWRLNLAGYRVVTVGSAPGRTRSAEHGEDAARVVAMWLKNLQDDTLRRSLGTDLLTLLARPDLGREVQPLVAHLEHVLAARSAVQKSRAVQDAAILDRFGWVGLSPGRTATEAGFEALVRSTLAPPRGAPARRTSAVVIADGGSDRRAAAVARTVGAEADAMLVVDRDVPFDDSLATAGLTVERTAGPDDLAKLAAHADVIVVGPRALAANPALAAGDAVVVVDLAGAGLIRDPEVDRVVARRGDAFVCDTDAQRLHWLGRLAAMGRTVHTEPGDLVMIVPLAAAPPPVATDSIHDAVVLDIASPPSAGVDVSAVRAAVAAAAGQPEILVVDSETTSEQRSAALARAAVVVRVVSNDPTTALASIGGAGDALAAGVPVVTTLADPAAPLIAIAQAGVIVRGIPEAAAAVHRVLTDPGLRAATTVLAGAVGSALSGPDAGPALRDLVRRPWRWQGAHAGGSLPDLTSGPIAQLLALREAETMRAAERLHAAQSEGQIAAAVAETEHELASARDRIRQLEAEVNEVNAWVNRLRRNPVMRVALKLRRMLLSA